VLVGGDFGWEAGARKGARLLNEPSAWAMSALQTSDADRALGFYRQLFGWRAEAFSMGDSQATLCRLPGYVGGEPQQPVPRDVVAAVMLAENGAESQWGVDFWIADADAAAAKMAELGGTVLAAPADVPGFRRAMLADPAGAAFSVSQLQYGEAPTRAA
jgi:predicted enzyme related to lactoylglutathione lyase